MHRVHAHRSIGITAPAAAKRKPLGPVRDFRARGKLTLVVIDEERCVLCEGTIDRFDRDAFHITSRCHACEGALEETL